MSSLKLKLDGWVKRDPDRSARNIPGKPLTQRQKKFLAEVCWKRCERAYKSRMLASALLSDYETEKDLVSEAYIAMWNILDKFDLSKCGELSRYDFPGKTRPKTIEFYFTNYFYGRVNFIACESRAMKKQRGVGPAEGMNEVAYEPEDTNSLSEYNHEYEITGVLLEKLKRKDKDFKRFFFQKYKLQCTVRELREEYGDRYNLLSADLARFIDEVKRNHRVDFK